MAGKMQTNLNKLLFKNVILIMQKTIQQLREILEKYVPHLSLLPNRLA